MERFCFAARRLSFDFPFLDIGRTRSFKKDGRIQRKNSKGETRPENKVPGRANDAKRTSSGDKCYVKHFD